MPDFIRLMVLRVVKLRSKSLHATLRAPISLLSGGDVPSPGPQDNDEGADGSGNGNVVAIILGIAIFILLLVCIGYWFCKDHQLIAGRGDDDLEMSHSRSTSLADRHDSAPCQVDSSKDCVAEKSMGPLELPGSFDTTGDDDEGAVPPPPPRDARASCTFTLEAPIFQGRDASEASGT